MSQKYNLNFNLVHTNNESNFILNINNIEYTGNISYNYYDKNTIISLLNLIYLRINNGQYFCTNKKIYLIYNDILDLYLSLNFLNNYNNITMNIFDFNKINLLTLYLKTNIFDNNLSKKINYNYLDDLEEIFEKKLIIN